MWMPPALPLNHAYQIQSCKKDLGVEGQVAPFIFQSSYRMDITVPWSQQIIIRQAFPREDRNSISTRLVWTRQSKIILPGFETMAYTLQIRAIPWRTFRLKKSVKVGLGSPSRLFVSTRKRNRAHHARQADYKPRHLLCNIYIFFFLKKSKTGGQSESQAVPLYGRFPLHGGLWFKLSPKKLLTERVIPDDHGFLWFY